jgi:hypothetical protein
MSFVAAPLVLREGDRDRLKSLTRSSSAPAGLVKRARIVLLAADGISNTEIARMAGVSADGDLLAEPVRAGGPGRAWGRAPFGPATEDR